MNEKNHISQIFELFQMDRVLFLILGLIVISFIVKYLGSFSKKAQDRFPEKRLALLQVTTVLSFLISILGSLALIYTSLRPPKELIIALGGSAAVAIGFALKDIVASLIAGFILLFDRPFQVGDRVEFGDAYGEITKIGLRAVRLVTLDDSLVTIPNSKFISEAVSSGNAGALDMMVVASFSLSLDADLRKARQLIREVVYTSRYVYLKKPVNILFEEIDDFGLARIKMKVKAYVLDVNYEKSFVSDIVLRGEEALKEAQVKRSNQLHPSGANAKATPETT